MGVYLLQTYAILQPIIDAPKMIWLSVVPNNEYFSGRTNKSAGKDVSMSYSATYLSNS